MKKKVLVLWPPQLMFYGSVFRHFTFVGETLDYLVKNTDADIDYIDAGVDMYHIKTFINKFKEVDVLIIYSETYIIESSRKMAKLAKQTNPNIKIIGFGRSFCYMPQYFLENNFDAVITNGHWEKPLADYINETPAEESAEYLTKYGYVGKVYRLKPEEWGNPRLDMMPVDRYFELTNKKQLEICVNKGCPYNCTFCSEKFVYGKQEGRRSVESIIKYLNETHNMCETYFFDATTFTYDEEWVKNLCEEIKKLPYKVKWCTTTRLDELDEEIVKQMAEAGCFRLSVGVETLNFQTQKSLQKPIDKDNMIKMFDLLLKYGIMPRVLLIGGLPNQSKKELMQTYETIRKMKLDFRIKEFAPYNDILKDGVSEDIIRRFDRTEYYSDDVKIDGLSSEKYIEMIFADKGR